MPYVEEYDLTFDFNRKIIVAALRDIFRSGMNTNDAEKRVVVKLVPCRRTLAELPEWFADYLVTEGLNIDGKLMLCFREDWVMKNQRELGPFIEKTAALGCASAMDHVGTSRYTPELVDSVKPALVKLSPQMVKQLISPQSGDALGMLRQLQSKHMNIVAGSVETADMFTVLMSLGIQQFQGYFVQHPAAALDYTVNRYDM
jgi:EAL domain-containing protein (putative c-di-GMP-specific phosphodiesterase class I)